MITLPLVYRVTISSKTAGCLLFMERNSLVEASRAASQLAHLAQRLPDEYRIKILKQSRGQWMPIKLMLAGANVRRLNLLIA